MRDFIAEREKCDALVVALNIEGERKLPARYELALFRIIQEALNNVVKHARTNQASVTLHFGEDTITLLIEDQGQGFNCQSQHSDINALTQSGQGMPTYGLTSMRERAELLEGTFQIESSPGLGTRIAVHVPNPTLLRSDFHDRYISATN